MTPKITNAIEALVEALRDESPEQMTTFRLFVNCEERVIETSERTPAQLKAAGISMRNLRGDFIRENDPSSATADAGRELQTKTQTAVR